MAKASRSAVQSLTATIRLGREEFAFRLLTRPLALGDFGTIPYYWIDSSELRQVLGCDAGGANFRACVGHWWAAVRAGGRDRDEAQRAQRVLALCYPLVSRDKSLQVAYRDAYLDPKRLRSASDSLDDEIRGRVRDVVRRRDRRGVQDELDSALGRLEPAGADLPELVAAFDRWVGAGVDAFDRVGMAGMGPFLERVDSLLTRYRKRGGHPRRRQFLNLFAYEAKVNFYRCYANAWVDLVPWLVEHRGLDPLGARFLRFWHHQNQPIAIPPVARPGGIDPPPAGEDGLAGPEAEGPRVADPAGAETHVRDVFNGQVLALHPLSGFFMMDDAARAIAGRFFASDRFAPVMAGRDDDCPEYWDLVGAILMAAHVYRVVADELAARRGVRLRVGDAAGAIAGPPGATPEAGRFEDYALVADVHCPDCGGIVHFVRYHPAEPDADRFRVDFICRACTAPVPATFGRDRFEAWLLSDAD